MTETITEMMETYPAEINTDRQLLAECVRACSELPRRHRVRGRASERGHGRRSDQVHP